VPRRGEECAGGMVDEPECEMAEGWRCGYIRGWAWAGELGRGKRNKVRRGQRRAQAGLSQATASPRDPLFSSLFFNVHGSAYDAFTKQTERERERLIIVKCASTERPSSHPWALTCTSPTSAPSSLAQRHTTQRRKGAQDTPPRSIASYNRACRVDSDDQLSSAFSRRAGA
jgi:hypothetical protein